MKKEYSEDAASREHRTDLETARREVEYAADPKDEPSDGGLLVITFSKKEEFWSLPLDVTETWDLPLIGIGDGSPQAAHFIESTLDDSTEVEVASYRIVDSALVVAALERMRKVTPGMTVEFRSD